MKEYQRFVLENDRFYRDSIARTEINLTSADMQKLLGHVFTNLSNVGECDGVKVGISAAHNAVLVSCRIPSLIIATGYEVVDEKYITPNYLLEAPDAVHLNLKWNAPPDMKLVFVSESTRSDNTYLENKCYLFAICPSEKCWLLPLPNIHADSRVCTNTDGTFNGTLQQVFSHHLNMLIQSKWNSDLLTSEILKCSRGMFRWDAKTDPFVQVTTDCDWTKFCTLVAPKHIRNICIPN